MSAASFRFHGELERFLPRQFRGSAFAHECARAATLKQAIESLGVPHTEVGRLCVNAQPATLARTVRENDAVEAFPHQPGEAPFEEPLAFIADAHMGGLARMLRMLGFDATYDNTLHDPVIVERGAAERRVVLTRDRELLKRRDVLRGCYVHALKPEDQLREVAHRYGIAARMQPFTLCLHCNLPLEPAKPEAVLEQVPERIRLQYHQFRHCAGCERIYWEGSHWDRMRNVLAIALDVPISDMR
ncbi:MAG: Mut7-C RNAse domain-containing protein [Burkholderiales bacterium]